MELSPTTMRYGCRQICLEPVQVLWGYEYIRQNNPANPLGIGATAQGGYVLSEVEDNNLDSPKTVQVFWTGVKYAFNSQAEITLSYYHEIQNDFRVPSTCSPAAGFRSSCAGRSTKFRFMRIITSPSVSTLCRHCLFQRHRRSGHRHSSRPRRSLLLQQQHCSDGWCSLHL